MADRIICPNCGHTNSPHRVTCKQCRISFQTQMESESTPNITPPRPLSLPDTYSPKSQTQQVALSLIKEVTVEELDQSRLDTLLNGAEPFDTVLNSPSNPITLDGASPPYEILEGQHRVYLARQKGYTYIPAQNLWKQKQESPVVTNALSMEQRKEIIDREVAKYVQLGWRVNSRTDTTAQLVRDQSASCLVALILAIFFVVPAILYLILYKGTLSLYLEVDAYGNVKSTKS